jgi:hypothetical protein
MDRLGGLPRDPNNSVPKPVQIKKKKPREMIELVWFDQKHWLFPRSGQPGVQPE